MDVSRWATWRVHTTRWWTAILAIAVVAGVTVAGLASADRAEADAASLRVNSRLGSVAVGATWTYVGSDVGVQAHKYLGPGRYAKPVTFNAATPLYTHPFQGRTDWRWAQVGSSFYAVESRFLRIWSCDNKGTWIRTSKTETVRLANVATASVVGVVAAGEWVWSACSESFVTGADSIGSMYCAAIGCGPARYILVYSDRIRPYCTATSCTAAQGTVRAAWGYIDDPNQQRFGQPQ